MGHGELIISDNNQSGIPDTFVVIFRDTVGTTGIGVAVGVGVNVGVGVDVGV